MRFITPIKTPTLFIITLLLAGCASDGHIKRWGQCALIGAGTGALVGAAGNSESASKSGQTAAYGAIGGALVGAALCALTGGDSDQDGVPDKKDRCMHTPKGVKVDNSGCPVDSDGDGVPDYMDKCANTPNGVAVDANGCPDSDGDGVPDNMDRCPNTPAGVAVDQSGCPTDSDGDGVPNGIDKCPNTPKGVPVNADGCPLQRDLGIVYFGFNKTDIDQLGRQVLDQIAEVAKQHTGIRLTAVGYTDSTGPLEYNEKLALRRAESVKQYLEGQGVSGNRITAAAGGVMELGDQTSQGRRSNRHVSITIEQP
ncbi:OmpA family protein [Endozoicomonas sp. SCSIO W0465]|uniref:OmpA family protein n=1 Tax=Endozoicomonas sp. SCSIO W0465 TaxID=2918516 RepID=UPI00207607CD|nr:OmpA family protein [Endozoicomonas sp. SCSIO W0465]USE33867.1 thrombospondin type 3 repeat-containing protein [Endozoicomonas sp. SCSIO W0465]